MGVKIQLYENWMKEQVVQLFCGQYAVEYEKFSSLFTKFYEHGFQRDKCIRIVAMDGDRVAGFQSFFYWPYVQNGRTYNSYQSGNSLVGLDYRGQGIFQQLLNYVYSNRKEFNINFLVGFPITASYNSLIRNGWKHVLDLQWFVKLNNPLFFLFREKPEKIDVVFNNISWVDIEEPTTGCFRLSSHKEFQEWRSNYSQKKKHHFIYQENDLHIRFELKAGRRKQIIYLKELIIGEIQTNSYDHEFIKRGITSLLKKIRKLRFITFVSVAINRSSKVSLANDFSSLGFKPINKHIHFMVQDFGDNESVENAPDWILYRSDVDTW